MEGRRDTFFLAEKQKKEKPDKQDNWKKSGFKRQENFDENRNGLETNGEKKEKKPFDKKTYRLKKYSKKYKLEQWEDQRKKKLLRKYYKETKYDKSNEVPGTYFAKAFDEDALDSAEVGRFVKHPDLIEKENATKPKTKKDPYWKAKEQFNKLKQEKEEKHKEIERIKEERKQKMEEYKKKKQEKFKKLSKKTKRGQPVMTGRLELLLEKLQKG